MTTGASCNLIRFLGFPMLFTNIILFFNDKCWLFFCIDVIKDILGCEDKFLKKELGGS